MRPFLHPDINDVPVESILHALSDPVRVSIYANILAQECSQNCSTYLHVLNKPIPKSTLSQHFKVLREAGLICSERRGVEVHNTARYAEIERRYPGLVLAIVTAHNIQLAESSRNAKKRAAKKSVR